MSNHQRFLNMPLSGAHADLLTWQRKHGDGLLGLELASCLSQDLRLMVMILDCSLWPGSGSP